MSDSHKIDINNVTRLVEAAKAGDRDAFDELVRFYQRRAMELAVKLLGNVTEAAEVVQAGFVKAYLNIGKLKKPERFGVWLLRIITNQAISKRRSAKRALDKIQITDSYESSKTALPLENSITEELKKAIYHAMLKLSKKEAKAISLCGLEGLAYKEVAQIMRCSVPAVRWHVFQARQKLKKLLKEYL